MNYVLLCPKCSIKHLNDEIRALGGFWNGIGYAFPPGTKELIREWYGGKPLIALIEIPWEGTWEKYRQFCRNDWEYVQSLEREFEIWVLKHIRGDDEEVD